MQGRRAGGRAAAPPLPLPYHCTPTAQALPQPPVQERKPSPLQRGGTLSGAAAAGKDASDKFKNMAEGAAATSGPVLQVRAALWSCWRPAAPGRTLPAPCRPTAVPLLAQPAASRPPCRPCSTPPPLQMVDGRFEDFRWKGGRWDLSMFK